VLRRTLLTRAPMLLAAAALVPGLACRETPAATAGTLRLLAPARPGREARMGAWNERQTGGAGRLELLHPPDGADWSAALAAFLAAAPEGAELLWLDLLDLPQLALRRRLAGLQGRVKRDRFNLKQFMPPALQAGYGLDEELYALPEEVEAAQVYFNRDHFQAAGIDMRRSGFDFERPDMTWEGLRRASLDLLSAPRPGGRVPFFPGHDGAPLELWGWQNGGEWLSADGRRASFTLPPHVEALGWLVAHGRELGSAAAQAGEARDGEDRPEAHPLLQGRVSICVDGTRLISAVTGWHAAFPLGYVETPRRERNRPLVSWNRATGYAMSAGAPDAAWDALRFLISEAAAAADAAASAALAPLSPETVTEGAPRPGPAPGRPLWYPPYTGQLALDEQLAQRYLIGSKLLDEGRDHGLEQLRYARSRPASPAPREIWPLLSEARRRALRGEVSPQEALAEAQREAQARLDGAWRALGR
jgi:multiple sugar transport system substrate-binding protein